MIRIAKIFGIEIKVHFSWFGIVALIAYSLRGYFKSVVLSDFPDFPNADILSWVFGVSMAISLFVCVLIHELAHSLMAKRLGYKAQSITLFLLGGMSSIEGEIFKPPKHDFWIVAVGPLASLALGAIFFAAHAWVLSLDRQAVTFFLRVSLFYLMFINVVFAAFNSLPAFPMDGGRMFVAVMRGVFRAGDMKAINIAFAVSCAFCLLFAGFALFQFYSTGNLLSLWPALVAVFLFFATRAEKQEAKKEKYRSETTTTD